MILLPDPDDEEYKKLTKKLSELQSAGKKSDEVHTLPDGRIRYYEKERLAKTEGPTRGNSRVVEYDPKTGQSRAWEESYNHKGEVTRVHPKSLNGG